jgi:serine/threonine protein kinase
MIELPITAAGSDENNVDSLAVATRLGEFEIRGLIGVGGFGMVYRAYDHSLQRDVAIKEYMPTALACRSANKLKLSVRFPSDQRTFLNGLQSFVDEARMLAKFEHPSLVRVFRFWEANETAYMVMPLYRGVTLKQARQSMLLPPTEAWLRKVLWSILGALKVLHRGNALHRDVSPDNIFLQDSGPPVLLDLGAARFAIDANAIQHSAILKVNYAPIEQFADAHGLQQGPWTDLYALAAVVHGMLCNVTPTPATIRVLRDDMPAFDKIAKTVALEFGRSYSEQFVDGIKWGLQLQPQNRPQSVREFVRALGISTPQGMSTFDWRADLGPARSPSVHAMALSVAPDVEDKTRVNQTNTDFATTQQFVDSDDKQAPDPAPPAEVTWESEEAPPRPGPEEMEDEAQMATPWLGPDPMRTLSSGMWFVVSMVVLTGLGATAWVWQNASSHSLALPADSVTAQTATAPASQSSSDIPGGTAALLSPVPAIPASAPTIPVEPIDPLPAVPAKALKTGERPRINSARTTKPEAPAPSTDPAPAPVQAQAADEPKPEPKPETPVPTPEILCVDSNFLTRPMCLYRACQRPELSDNATCVAIEQKSKRGTEFNGR